jgi:RNA exonuclease 1
MDNGGGTSSEKQEGALEVKNDSQSSAIEDKLPLPKSTENGRKWLEAVLKTREHDRYKRSFDFTKYKELDQNNGIQCEWIKAKPFGSWCESNPQAIAIDCEMCETKDPLSGAKNHKALCRVSVVNAENPDEVLLDTLVKPVWPVTDYRSRINGIKKKHLDSVEFTMRHAQAFMMALCSEETVIVGHALHNDLSALNMEHHCSADSSFLFHAKDSKTATVSLKDLVSTILQKTMPETHDSVNDARKALECVLHWTKNGGEVAEIERTSNSLKGKELFVHRIPKRCKAQNLSSMFQQHTDIEPTEIDEIEYSGHTGKTQVTFRTPRHAKLAFDSLEGAAEPDKSGRLQKKVYLRNGDYVRIRKMVFERSRYSISSPNKK